MNCINNNCLCRERQCCHVQDNCCQPSRCDCHMPKPPCSQCPPLPPFPPFPPVPPVPPPTPVPPVGTAYGTIVGTVERDIAVGALVPFDTYLSTPPRGISFTPGGTTVTVAKAGTYRVMYELITREGAVTFALVVNGVVLANSEVFSSDGGTSEGVATVGLTAGSTLGIIILEPNPALLRENLNAILDIMRIA